jgi:hypothetical protein
MINESLATKRGNKLLFETRERLGLFDTIPKKSIVENKRNRLGRVQQGLDREFGLCNDGSSGHHLRSAPGEFCFWPAVICMRHALYRIYTFVDFCQSNINFQQFYQKK